MGYRGWGRRVVGVGFAAVAALLTVALAGAEGFYPVGALFTTRPFPAAVSLQDGTVAVVSDASIERYDPATRSFAYAASLPTYRQLGFTATLLDDGRVLIIGGELYGSALVSAEIYDPATNAATPTGSLSTPRAYHTATLLPGGRVLVTGGHSRNYFDSALASAEIYDPGTGTFSPAGDMAHTRQNATATLVDGRVLVAGGYDSNGFAQRSAELFDPLTGEFVPAGDMSTGRASHTATIVADGLVLLAGGYPGVGGVALASAEVYDPTAGAFFPVGDMTSRRGGHTATALASGRVLVTGGTTLYPFMGQTLSSAEIWDPETRTFAQLAHGMKDPRERHAAAALSGGEVLVAGGLGGAGSPLWTAEVYSPDYENTQAPVLYLPQDVVQGATGPEGAYVWFSITAIDDGDGYVVADCQPPSGLFPIGTTLVTCTATDSWGNAASGSFQVTVLAPLTMTLTFDAFGSIDSKTGVATVSGTVTCSRPATLYGSGQLMQTVASRAVVSGYLSFYDPCGPEPRAWVRYVSANNGRFNSGKASVSATVSASDSYGSYSSFSGERQIQLRGKN